MKTLLGITTHNQLDYTKEFVASLMRSNFFDNPENHAVFVDDYSTDGNPEWLSSIRGVDYGRLKRGSKRFEIIRKTKRFGLTHSWNTIYKKFSFLKFEKCVISNNDVVLPRNIQAFIDRIDGCMLGPVTNDKGVANQGYSQQKISEAKKGLTRVNNLNGFFFGFDRSIRQFELADIGLFDPNTINVGNEDELCRRLGMQGYPMHVDGDTFVFHYKGISFNKDFSDRDALKDYGTAPYDFSKLKAEFEEIWKQMEEQMVAQKQPEVLSLYREILCLPKRENALELGVHYGGTTRYLSHLFKNVHSIDKAEYRNKEVLEQRIKGTTDCRWTEHLGDTTDPAIIKEIEDLGVQFDLLFIDAGHTYENVKNDYENYKDFVRPGGLIVFHDILIDRFFVNAEVNVKRFWDEIKQGRYHTEFCQLTGPPVENLKFKWLNGMKPDEWGGIGVLYA